MVSSPRYTQAYLSAYSKNWGWFFVWGLLLLILGIVAVSAATLTTILSVIFLGFVLLIGGIVIIVDTFSFWWHQWSGFFLHLILGILYGVAGIMLIKSPIIASVSITLLLGIFYLILGAFRIFYSLSLRTPRWGWIFFNALISLLLGIFILASWPQSSLFIIGLFVGIDLILAGWAYIMTSLGARSLIK